MPRDPIRVQFRFGQGSSEGSDEPPPRPRLLGDEAELFESFHRRLTRIVQRLVNTSPAIVDDACNYAWTELVRCRPDRDGGWRSWLVTTAQREAWKLDSKERAHTGFEVDERHDGLARERADPRDVVAVRSKLRFALDVFATVREAAARPKLDEPLGARPIEPSDRSNAEGRKPVETD